MLCNKFNYSHLGIPVNGGPKFNYCVKGDMYAWRCGSFGVRVRVFHGSLRVRHGVMGRLGFSS